MKLVVRFVDSTGRVFKKRFRSVKKMKRAIRAWKAAGGSIRSPRRRSSRDYDFKGISLRGSAGLREAKRRRLKSKRRNFVPRSRGKGYVIARFKRLVLSDRKLSRYSKRRSFKGISLGSKRVLR